MNQETLQQKSENPTRKIKIEKVLLSASGKEQDLEKAKQLLKMLSGMKPQVITSRKRIPDFNVRPGLEVGTRVTLRGQKALDILKQLLGALNNTLDEEQVSENHFSFGINEYIDIPGVEYNRDIGIRGFNITVVFTRHGMRVKRKKIKSGSIPKKQYISQEEIMEFMKKNFQTEFV